MPKCDGSTRESLMIDARPLDSVKAKKIVDFRRYDIEEKCKCEAISPNVKVSDNK